MPCSSCDQSTKFLHNSCCSFCTSMKISSASAIGPNKTWAHVAWMFGLSLFANQWVFRKKKTTKSYSLFAGGLQISPPRKSPSGARAKRSVGGVLPARSCSSAGPSAQRAPLRRLRPELCRWGPVVQGGDLLRWIRVC